MNFRLRSEPRSGVSQSGNRLSGESVLAALSGVALATGGAPPLPRRNAAARRITLTG